MDKTPTQLTDLEQGIIDSCDDVEIMEINELLVAGVDFYDALEELGLIVE